jgi:hypothetical protein
MKPYDSKTSETRGAFKKNLQKGAHAVGDAIEKAGRKLQEKGSVKAGQKLENVGDSIEHSAD